MDDQTTQKYSKIWISDFFHSFPHRSRSFEKVDSSFKPENRDYLESLAFWALVPVAVCVLSWFFFIVYFICRCCQGQSSVKRSPSVCPRVTTGLFIFFAVGLLAFGLYENEEAHRGVAQFEDGIRDINRTIGSANRRLHLLDASAEDVSGPLSKSILEVVAKFDNKTVQKRLALLVREIQKQASGAKGQIDDVKIDNEFEYLDELITTTDTVEWYRWLGSVAVSSFYVCIFFFVLVGLLIRSKPLLILTTVVCVFGLVVIWSLSGTHLAASVGLADFCVDPDAYIESMCDDASQKAIVKAYVECVNNTEPYGNQIQQAIRSLTQAGIFLDSIVHFVGPVQLKMLYRPVTNMQLELKSSMANLSILMDNVGICTNIHNYYMQALDGACVNTIESTAWLSLIAAVVGLLSFVITVSNSMLWRQYVKNRTPATPYNQVDDTDPFLPRPPPYDSDYGAVGYSSPMPWSERGTLQRYTDSPFSDESLMMLPHAQQRHSAPLPVDESPPPAYHPGRFVRQYAASENR